MELNRNEIMHHDGEQIAAYLDETARLLEARPEPWASAPEVAAVVLNLVAAKTIQVAQSAPPMLGMPRMDIPGLRR